MRAYSLYPAGGRVARDVVAESLTPGSLCVLRSSGNGDDRYYPFRLAKYKGVEPPTPAKSSVRLTFLFYVASNTSDIDLAGRDTLGDDSDESDDDAGADPSVLPTQSVARRQQARRSTRSRSRTVDAAASAPSPNSRIDFSPEVCVWSPSEDFAGDFHKSDHDNCILFANLTLHEMKVPAADYNAIMQRVDELNAASSSSSAAPRARVAIPVAAAAAAPSPPLAAAAPPVAAAATSNSAIDVNAAVAAAVAREMAAMRAMIERLTAAQSGGVVAGAAVGGAPLANATAAASMFDASRIPVLASPATARVRSSSSRRLDYPHASAAVHQARSALDNIAAASATAPPPPVDRRSAHRVAFAPSTDGSSGTDSDSDADHRDCNDDDVTSAGVSSLSTGSAIGFPLRQWHEDSQRKGGVVARSRDYAWRSSSGTGTAATGTTTRNKSEATELAYAIESLIAEFGIERFCLSTTAQILVRRFESVMFCDRTGTWVAADLMSFRPAIDTCLPYSALKSLSKRAKLLEKVAQAKSATKPGDSNRNNKKKSGARRYNNNNNGTGGGTSNNNSNNNNNNNNRRGQSGAGAGAPSSARTGSADA
jgi:chorismate mutase